MEREMSRKGELCFYVKRAERNDSLYVGCAMGQCRPWHRAPRNNIKAQKCR